MVISIAFFFLDSHLVQEERDDWSLLAVLFSVASFLISCLASVMSLFHMLLLGTRHKCTGQVSSLGTKYEKRLCSHQPNDNIFFSASQFCVSVFNRVFLYCTTTKQILTLLANLLNFFDTFKFCFIQPEND